MAYFHDLTYVCAPSAFQHGAAAGLEELPPSFYAELAADYQSKRTRILAALSDAGLEPCVPAEPTMCWPAQAISRQERRRKGRHLLAVTGVAAVAGSAFFRAGAEGQGHGENLLRFCFAKRDRDLDDACARLRKLR